MLLCYFPGISLGPVQRPKVSKSASLFSLIYFTTHVSCPQRGRAWSRVLEKSQSPNREVAQCQNLLICLALTNSIPNQSTLESFSLSLNNSWLFNFGPYQKIYNA